MKLIRCIIIFSILFIFLSTISKASADFDEFRSALKSGEIEKAAVILHEIVITDQFSPHLWSEAADICHEQKMVSPALVFYKAALNLEKNSVFQNQIKKKIESIKTDCCTGFKLDYVVTFATLSVKLLKNVLNLPLPEKLEPALSGAKELPGLVISSDRDIARLEKSTGINARNTGEIAYIDTNKSGKTKGKKKAKETTIDNTVPVEKMPSYNQSELMKNIVYPEEAILKMKQGKVIVKVFISSEGEPLKPEIKSSTNKMFNRAAMDAVLKTDFEPAKQNGQPVGCWMFINIDFVLKRQN